MKFNSEFNSTKIVMFTYINFFNERYELQIFNINFVFFYIDCFGGKANIFD